MTYHTIYYGDCLNVLKELERNSVHLIITSPPYYNAREYSNYKTYQDYLDFMDEVISLLSLVVVEGGYFCLNSTCYTENKVLYPIPFDLLNLCNKNGFELIWDVIWLKPKYTQALWRSSDYNYKNPYPFNFYLNCFHEYIWICRLGNKMREINKETLEDSKIVGEQVEIKGRMKDEKVLKYSYREWKMEVATPRKEGHTAAFPIELPKYCIEQFSVKNDIILDPFLGTGTTSKAAMLLERNSIGIELNKEYFKIIKNKLIPEQRDIYQFLNNEDLDNQGVIRNSVEFKNINFLKETHFEIYTKKV